MIAFVDGRTEPGDLLGFSLADGTAEYRPRKSDAAVRVGLNDIRTLNLTRAITMHRTPAAGGAGPQGVPGGVERQKFALLFRDGAKLSGETVGCVKEQGGLFLYLAGADNTVTRLFAPFASIKSYQVGEQIGRLLIDGHKASEQDIEAGLEKQRQLRAMRLGDYLLASQVVTEEELKVALKRQRTASGMKLGEALIRSELVTQDQIDQALQMQRVDRNRPLGDILVELGIVERETVNGAIANQLGIPYLSLRKFTFDPKVTNLLDAKAARKYMTVPISRSGDTLVVAMGDPLKRETRQLLGVLTGLKIEPTMAEEDDIHAALDRIYGSTLSEDKVAELASELAVDANQGESDEIQITESDNTLVRLVNRLIVDAYEQRVSDIHIETNPGKANTQVRFRKDGTLFDYLEIPSIYRNALASRIKIMCHLDIAEKRKPQDGKIDFQRFGSAKVELRVATIPTANGLEDIVLRVLAASKPIPLGSLGLHAENLALLKKIAARPYGLFLVCGPTGSGKTTTLHSVLGHINVRGRKIWTAEDPIEITQKGLRQVQVNARIGWTFAATMRSFLRADPDVIMLGEMRDAETAKVAIEGSLTGHLVLSTLHTNSATESVVRLLDLGAEPFNFADALLGVLAQRLAKRLCTGCRQARTASSDEMRELLGEYCLDTALDGESILQQWERAYADAKGEFTLYAAGGCETCNKTGYRGRIGLHELLVGSPATKKLIQTRATVAELQARAITEGMRTLKQDGIDKILQGHTDIEQIRSVCG
jgi:type II secretory ATPase GspE/PulE/Tfp pilus assembly ATPase PilB-like protein